MVSRNGSDRLFEVIMYYTHTPAKGRCLAHTAEAGAFVFWRVVDWGGEMFIEMNKSIERGLNLSRS